MFFLRPTRVTERRNYIIFSPSLTKIIIFVTERSFEVVLSLCLHEETILTILQYTPDKTSELFGTTDKPSGKGKVSSQNYMGETPRTSHLNRLASGQPSGLGTWAFSFFSSISKINLNKKSVEFIILPFVTLWGLKKLYHNAFFSYFRIPLNTLAYQL